MGSSKGGKKSLAVPDTIGFTTQQRVTFLAELIVERIIKDKAEGHPLLKKLEGSGS